MINVDVILNVTDSYQGRRQAIYKKYIAAKNLNTIDTQENFLNWLLNIERPALAPNSWRITRNAAKMFFSDKELLAKLQSTKPSLSKKDIKNKQTSSNRQKSLPEKDMQAIRDWCRNSRSKYAQALMLWLDSTLLTGLRPVEWLSSKLIDHPDIEGAVALQCLNAKGQDDENGIRNVSGHNAEKTHQITRTIDLAHLSEAEINLIQKQVQLGGILRDVNEKDPTYFEKKFYKNLADLMGRCCDKCFRDRQERPTIYSARHQFASDLKASLKKQGFSSNRCKQIIAVLMGQGSIKTATYNYGMTSRGDSDKRVPMPSDRELKAAMGRIRDKD